MRPVVFTACLLAPTALVAAEPAPKSVSTSNTQEFRLGGAAARSSSAPDIDLSSPSALSSPVTPATRGRISLPLSLDGLQAQDVGTMGPATLFMGEGQDEGRDAVELGTYLSHGAARAGVSLTFLEQQEEVTRSEVFIDYALTEQFSVGISGILNNIDAAGSVPQIGLSAEFSTDGGAYFQGGVADAPELEPVFGLSVGFRF